MRMLGITSVYCLGLCSTLVAMTATGVPGILLFGALLLAWSCWYGFVARRWTALITPFLLAGGLLPLALAMGSNASGDGGAETMAGLLGLGVLVMLLQVPSIGSGLVLTYFLRGPLSSHEATRVH